MDNFLISIAGLAAFGFLIVSILVGITTTRRRQDAMDRYRYRPKKQLMVGPEKRCFQLLNEIFGQTFYIIPQVSVSSLLSHKVGTQNRYEAYSFIKDKYVDFVFCNKATMRPVCAVKIDDGPHSNTNKAPGSDPKDMQKFFRSAHLPFVRITNPRSIDRQDIIDEFSRVIYETSKLQNKK